MARSPTFIAASVVTAASLAISSIASARPLAPGISVDTGRSSLVRKIDAPGYRQDRKRVQWEHSYGGQWGPPGRGAPPPRGRAVPRHGGPPPQKAIIVRPVQPGPRLAVPPQRRVYYRNVWVVRPYGHWYPGYGYHYHDHDAYPWLAFTAITLSLLTLLTVAQQRAQEQAQIDATTAPVGTTITWNDANASGGVSVLRDGHSSDGQYCREFLQTVTVGGRSEQAYGTACRQPDGSWRIVDTR